MARTGFRAGATLSIDPCSKGFGFVVLEGVGNLVDWGVVRVFSRDDFEFLARIEELFRRWEPNLVVIEDAIVEPHRGRARRWIVLVTEYAKSRGVRVVSLTKSTVRSALHVSSRSKQDVAEKIVPLFPELGPHLPVRRKIWKSEDIRINIFDALSFALVALSGFGEETGRSNQLPFDSASDSQGRIAW